MENSNINELIKSVEALVYYSQIHTVNGVQPVHMPDHETAWKNAQRWIWDNCKADKMGNYHLKKVPAGPRWVKAETKPDHNVGVLVFIPGEDNHITSGMWDIDNKWVLLDEYRTPEEEVTHWMPLPSFPEGYPANELPDEIGAMIKEIAREELGKKEQPAAGREEDAVLGILQYISESEFYYNHAEKAWLIKGTHSIKLTHNELIEKYELFKQHHTP